jgi:hypothetical protein
MSTIYCYREVGNTKIGFWTDDFICYRLNLSEQDSINYEFLFTNNLHTGIAWCLRKESSSISGSIPTEKVKNVAKGFPISRNPTKVDDDDFM